MSLAREIMRGLRLNDRLAVYGIQNDSRSLGTSATGARAEADDGMIGARVGGSVIWLGTAHGPGGLVRGKSFF